MTETHILKCAKGHKWQGNRQDHPDDPGPCSLCGAEIVRIICPKSCPEKLHRKLQPRSLSEIADSKPFASMTGAGERRQECLLHVAWSGLNDAGDDGRGHQRLRGRVMADLGLDAVPSPPFTAEEMERITFAAKMQALKCLRTRKKAART